MRPAALAAALLLAASAVHAQPLSQPTTEQSFLIGTGVTVIEGAKMRAYLFLDNESTSNAIGCCFISGCVPALNTQGSITLMPQNSASPHWREWNGVKVPGGPISCIAGGASTPLTVEE